MSFFRYDGVVRNAPGEAIPGALVYVCNQPANTSVIPPTPLTPLYSDSSGTSLANPVVVDGNGNFFYYAATGTYTLIFFDPFDRIPTTVFLDQAVLSPGGGTVTSVAETVPTEFLVSGSPITGAGTLAITKQNQNANTVWAGPASGPAAPSGFRQLVSADLPAGVGSVSSAALTFTPSALFTSSVGGSPITSSGTLAITLGLANQAANKFLAGPASGGTGPVTARFMVPADLPGEVDVTFSATPVFDASTGNLFSMTLTGNVTSSSVTNPTAGQRITVVLTQDGTGNRTFAWPSDFKGASAVAPDANSVSVQSFVRHGASSFWRADGAGLVTGS